MQEIHLTKKDFKIDWYSSTGGGGQHRNKHPNCCRITHIETGLRAQATESRERPINQKMAFKRLAGLILAHYAKEGGKDHRHNTTVIRNYNEPRNEVHDRSSGLKLPYKTVVVGKDLTDMIDARRIACGEDIVGEPR